jgi:Tol biopolymer transport system component
VGLSAGTKLGPHEIVAPLGAGGMGEVYRARDARLGRDVAVKVLPASFSSDASRLHRFEQEARAAAALSHPNILAVYDVGTENGAPYIISELLEGESLRDRLRTGPLSLRKATDYAAQIARGLAAAHEKGIVHRDLKPENIFITHDGRVKILDFGLAKLTQPDAAPESQTVTVHSDPGTVLGTVGYMSPEQVRGKPADARSDLFSFGAILYEMLSGKRAFHGESPAETMSAIMREEPPELTETNRNVPPALERIVRHCLEKNAAERFQSASDVGFALESLSDASGSGTTLHPIPEERKKARLVPAILALAAVVALAAGFLLGSRARPVSAPVYHRLTFQRGTVFSARFAPDGHTIIYAASWNGNPVRLYSITAELPESRAFDLDTGNLLAVSRTGEMALAIKGTLSRHRVLHGATLARMPVAGGAPREVLTDIEYADWDANGNLAVVRSAAGKHRLEYPVGKVLYETPGWISHIRISRSGDKIAFLNHAVWPDDRGSVAIVDLAGTVKTLSTGFESAQGLAWSPKDDEIWFTGTRIGVGNQLYAVSLSGKERLLLRVPGGLTLQDVAADGRLLLDVDRGRTILWGHTAGSSKDRDLSWFESSFAADISEDGDTVVLWEASDPAGPNYSVGIRKTDGSPTVRLGEGYAAGISPDGKWVISVLPGDVEHIVLLNTGAGEPRKLNVPEIEHYTQSHDPVFFPDGKRMLANSNVAAHAPRAYVVDLETGKARAITPEGVLASAPSPDGKFVAGTDAEEHLTIYPVEGGQPRVVPGSSDLTPLRWTGDGSGVYAVHYGENPMNIYRVDVATGRKQPIGQITPPSEPGILDSTGVKITPDGRSYVYGYRQILSDLYVVSGVQ